MFQWDNLKNLANIEKHGISFEQAKAIFSNSKTVHANAKIVNNEFRRVAIGKIGQKFYTCIYLRRYYGFRIISCRRSRPKEIEYYEKENG